MDDFRAKNIATRESVSGNTLTNGAVFLAEKGRFLAGSYVEMSSWERRA